ncbi:low temperature requirement protein A [Lentzea sp. BCCO 10_0856]|uniref:Low temperature requirement protein A n=1 Tax=Lentzea miocenica TaxID=3095431 RepID=A0ABU4T4J0_9PSEU|nr:low temperature requirement protein A [Lentzea sp. BCCO 10_0856]MDX8032994.1 low temperature requirement protein A [Lentzea sp. BCCO 10_0856]
MSAETHAPQEDTKYRVSTLELFFDLVFVFTITQLTRKLADDTSPLGFAQVVIMLFVILWMYFGYVWLTNAVPPNTTLRRVLLMAGMGGFLVIALAIPNAFDAAGPAFGVGYLIVNLVHSGLFIAAGGPGSAAAMARLAPFNLGSAGLVMAGGFLPPAARAAAWTAAVVLMIVSPYVNRRHGEFQIRSAHFVERHGLVVIVALGESIIAIGIGAAGLPLNLQLVVAALLGLALVYQLWWCYFGRDQDLRAEHSLQHMTQAERARAALSAFGWAHAPILLGIVVVAVGVKKTIGHATDHLYLSGALALGGGVAIFLAGQVYFRLRLRIGTVKWRAIGTVAALATVPIGLWLAIAQVAALVLVVGALLAVEEKVRA